MTATMTAVGVAPSGRVQRVLSPGGIEAWFVEEHTLPLVALQFAFIGGASQDPPDKRGAASLASLTLREGAGGYDSEAFQTRLDEHAVELSFSADDDAVWGSLRTLAEHAEEAFELARLAVCEARFDDEAVQRMRASRLSVLRHYANDPDRQATLGFYANAFPNHSYAHPTLGTVATVSGLGRADLARFRDAAMSRRNLRVTAVGAIDAASLGRALDHIFGGLPAAPRLVGVPDTMLQGAGKRVTIDLDVPQSTVEFGRAGIAYLDPDFMPALVVNHILGGGFTSRLFNEVRDKRGLAYSVHTSVYALRHSALFSGGTSTKNERVAESIEVIGDEIRKLAADGPEPDELRLAKQYLMGSYALGFDGCTSIARQLLSICVSERGIDYVDRRNGLVEAVTMEDACRAARRLLGDGSLLVVVAGRPEGLAQV